MNRDKAKSILGSCPPGADTPTDPEMQQAFEATREDGELSTWFQHEREFDRAVSRKLKSIDAPAGLRDSILAGARAPVLPFPSVRMRHAAVAALLLLCVGLAVIFSRHDNADPTISAQFASDFPWELVAYFDREPVFDQLSGNLAEVRNHLKTHGGPDTEAIPPTLEDMTRYRCRIFGREEKKVALICMQKEEKRLHLFVIDESSNPSLPADRRDPKYTARDPWSFAEWEHSGQVYVLATRGSVDDLRSVLASQ